MFFSYLIYYFSYFSFFLLGLIVYFFLKFKITLSRKILWGVVFFFTLLFIEARFIEPNMIVLEKTQINTGFKARIAVISDIHLGVFKGKFFLERLVSKINEQKDIDFVVIPGDFAFVFSENNDFEKMFSPLKELKVPVYAVLGNHDTQNPGPNIEESLINALEKNGVILLDNSSVKIKNINILGLGDNWIPNDKIELIDNFKKEDNLIVLAHNPDTTLKYHKNGNADITISGHTHGGQIRIPYLYKKVIPCIGDFDKGIYDYSGNKTFVTSGVGEVGLPMRFLNPPVIDILELY